jgi:16S rRNA (guanine966-N2)-methyltransferase
MRIIGGIHKGRIIAAPQGMKVRPTTDRVRQSMFNVLEHGKFTGIGNPIKGATVLDAFSGTGALAIEALSRGAASATCMDIDQRSLRQIEKNAASLSETQRLQVILSDATNPPNATSAANLIFLDPPYGFGQVEVALKALSNANWISKNAIVVAETGVKEDLSIIDGFFISDRRQYGKTAITFIQTC